MLQKIKRNKNLIIALLSIISIKVTAQDKGRWIITVNHPKAISYVDSIKFKDFDTRISAVGTYRVKTWRYGGVLVDTSITVRKDSISFLKIKINDTQSYAKYKSDKVVFQLKRWVPKMLVILSAITLQSNYVKSRDKADQLEKTYQDYKIQYDGLYTTGKINEIKNKSEATYDEYLKAVKKQNRNSAMRLIVPALIATTVIIDLTSKKPSPYVEVPLLTNNNTSNDYNEGNIGFRIVCKF